MAPLRKLLTAELREQLPEIYATERTPLTDKVAVAKPDPATVFCMATSRATGAIRILYVSWFWAAAQSENESSHNRTAKKRVYS